MTTAAKIFRFDTRQADSPMVELLWRTRSEPYPTFTSIAVSHWEMVVTRQKDRIRLTVRGPETRASIADIPQGADFFGIQFRIATFMPSLPAYRLVDNAIDLPGATSRSFWLNGSVWEFPDFDNADVFVNRLARKGLLARDSVVEAALRGEPTNLSVRSLQRRILRTTGLTRVAIKQIERANRAVELLDSRASILDAVQRLGYADQPHLTRALKRFIGYTPGQIVNAHDT